MAKLLLHIEDGTLKEIALNKERTTIGRRSDNDVCLTNAAVSSQHAVLVLILSDCFLEDLGSTNGTYVNSKQITRHFLQDQDVIEIGRHRLTFRADTTPANQTTPVLNEEHAVTLTELGGRPAAVQLEPEKRKAKIRVLSGPHAGRELPIDKDLLSLGKAGVQVVTITRRPHGYFLTHVEGDAVPIVNGKKLESSTYPLYSNDVVELVGVKLEFVLSSA